MALEGVAKEIQAKADAKAADIRAQRDAEIADINAKADAQISEMKAKQEKRIADSKESLARQERSSAEIESKKVILAKKKEVLAKAFESALEQLENAPADKKLAYYKAMVNTAKTVIPEPKALMSEKDDFTAEQLGVKAVEKDASIRSGLILQSEDGEMEVDMQYEVVLRSVWDRNLRQLSDILFG